MTSDHQFEYLQARLLKKDHRIGTLKGAIKAALPYFEEAALVASKYDRLHQSGKYTKDEIFQVIANLKGLIENECNHTTTN